MLVHELANERSIFEDSVVVESDGDEPDIAVEAGLEHRATDVVEQAELGWAQLAVTR